MNKLNLIITEQAYNDIDKIVNYIKKDNADAARKVLNLLIETCRLLSNFPELGSRKINFTSKKLLFFAVRKQYLIIYKIQKQKLIVVRILSSLQNISDLI